MTIDQKKIVLSELRKSLEKADEVYNKAYNEVQILRDKIIKLENELDVESRDKATKLLTENKFIRLNDNSVIYIDKFKELYQYDEYWYIDGLFVIFNKLIDGTYSASDMSEYNIGHLNEVRSIEVISKDEILEIFNKSVFKGLIESLK